MKLIAIDDVAPQPWKNGGGATRELAIYPPAAKLDDFHWRISIAEVAVSGAFSIFPDVDRIIMLLDGKGLHLDWGDNKSHLLTTPFAPYRFRGEQPLYATVVDGVSLDLNLMLRRDLFDGDIHIWRDIGTMTNTADLVLLLCARGAWRFDSAHGTYEMRAKQVLVDMHWENAVVATPLVADSVLIGIRVYWRLVKEN